MTLSLKLRSDTSVTSSVSSGKSDWPRYYSLHPSAFSSSVAAALCHTSILVRPADRIPRTWPGSGRRSRLATPVPSTLVVCGYSYYTTQCFSERKQAQHVCVCGCLCALPLHSSPACQVIREAVKRDIRRHCLILLMLELPGAQF